MLNTDLTYDVLMYDYYFGKRILSLSEIPVITRDAVQFSVGQWFIVKNKEGLYGKVSGGNNNIACFIGWCTGATGWIFNPINIEDYVWSEINEAFMHKVYASFKDVRLLYKKWYTGHKLNGEFVSLYDTSKFWDAKLIWSKQHETT